MQDEHEPSTTHLYMEKRGKWRRPRNAGNRCRTHGVERNEASRLTKSSVAAVEARLLQHRKITKMEIKNELETQGSRPLQRLVRCDDLSGNGIRIPKDVTVWITDANGENLRQLKPASASTAAASSGGVAQRRHGCDDFSIVTVHPDLILYVDSLQRKNAECLSFYPRCVFEREAEKGRIFLGLLNGEPCGYLYVGARGLDVKCHQVCIQYDARRRLYGAQLVNAMEEYARGAQTLTLRCGFDLDANTFWAEMGYTCVAIQPGGVRRMRKINIWRKDLQIQLWELEGIEPAEGKTDASVWRKNKQVGLITQFARGRQMQDYRKRITQSEPVSPDCGRDVRATPTPSTTAQADNGADKPRDDGAQVRSESWLVRFRGWWRDHVSIEGRIDKDWRDFGGMSDDELEREYDKLLTGGGKPKDRFRRLCQYLSLRWLRDRKRTNHRI